MPFPLIRVVRGGGLPSPSFSLLLGRLGGGTWARPAGPEETEVARPPPRLARPWTPPAVPSSASARSWAGSGRVGPASLARDHELTFSGISTSLLPVRTGHPSPAQDWISKGDVLIPAPDHWRSGRPQVPRKSFLRAQRFGPLRSQPLRESSQSLRKLLPVLEPGAQRFCAGNRRCFLPVRAGLH